MIIIGSIVVCLLLLLVAFYKFIQIIFIFWFLNFEHAGTENDFVLSFFVSRNV